MKKITMILAAAMAVAMPASLYAQMSASANATVTATVVSSLSLSNTAPLSFGTILTPAAATTSTVAPTSTNAAAFTASGTANTKITVSWSTPSPLTSGSNNIGVNSVSVAGLDTSAQGSQTGLTSGQQVTLSGSGNYYFWVGGTIALSANQPTGNYTGTFTLNVAY